MILSGSGSSGWRIEPRMDTVGSGPLKQELFVNLRLIGLIAGFMETEGMNLKTW